MGKRKKTALIFDMYGVILKERTGSFVPYVYAHFDASQHERLKRLLDEERLFTRAGYGELSSDAFLSRLGFQDPAYHMRRYIENFLTLDEAFIPFAEKYASRYDFVLLSTDVSEWSAYITAYHRLDPYFKRKIVSGDVKCRKPDRRIYALTLEAAQKAPEECLFIDDSIRNIEAAGEMGIETLLFNRFQEAYEGAQVTSFEALDRWLCDGQAAACADGQKRFYPPAKDAIMKG